MLQTGTVNEDLLKVLREIQSDNLFADFALVGGTALALQIGHRESVDIDLFTAEIIHQQKIEEYLQVHYKDAYEIIHSEDAILQLIIGGNEEKQIKVDFVSTEAMRHLLEPVNKEDGIRYLGLKDITAMKLRAIENKRNKAKDFIDICYLLEIFTLDDAFEFYKYKYQTDSIIDVKKALSESSIVNPYEWETIKMLKHDFFISDVKRMLDTKITEYDKTHRLPLHKKFCTAYGKIFRSL
ncbi:MAG: nucleotidyl transferase AbiEii/AbiGii toxin family protein [Spirochaetaceae bacterium]|jgi:hypothetical protein|nr:nucleotidyl transferase AbiEii/AbiGii toxin family protein [Spirochaetaceae bacterium]